MKDRSKKLLVINTGKKGDQEGVYSASAKPSVAGGAGMALPGNLSDYLLKSIWDRVWEIKTDSQGNEYIFGKLPVVTQYGITMYADGGELNLPSIYAGIPFDNKTIWLNPETKKVEVIGGTGGEGGGGLTEVYWDDVKLKPTFALVATSGKYADLSGLPDLGVYATTEYLTAELKKYVTLNTEQTIGAHKNFLNGLSIGGLPITKSQDDVIYLDANLVVRGGITMYASDSAFTPSTIMDGVVVDNVTILKDTATGVLMINPELVLGGGGGEVSTVAWGNVLGKPFWITDTKPSYSYSEISGTPTLLSSFHNDVGFVDSSVLDGYLPLSGGKLRTNTSSIVLTLDASSMGDKNYLQFYNSYYSLGCLGFSAKDNPVYRTSSGTNYKLWHSGNFTPSDYLLASNYTASDILTKILTVDGADSGLDADLLDGLQPSELNVGSATKLKTPRTIWGQSFDGSGDVSGDLSLGFKKILGGDGDSLLSQSSNDGSLYLGYGSSEKKHFTYINGYSIRFSYGTSHTEGMRLTTEGNVLIGTTTSSGYKLNVAGDIHSATNVRTPIATIDGIPIYKSQDDVLYIDGNLAVRGGITMYATDAIDVPSIIDALPPASYNEKGIAAFNPNDFSVVDGYVSFIGSGGVDESVLADYAQKTDLSKYLPLSGGELSNTGYVLTINRLEDEPAWIQFKSNWEVQGSIGAYNNSLLWFDKNFKSHTILHSGNWSQYVTAADGGSYLPLSGGRISNEGTGLYVNRTTSYSNPHITFESQGAARGDIGVGCEGNPMFYSYGYEGLDLGWHRIFVDGGTDYTLNQSSWGNGLKLNRTVANGGAGISSYSQGTFLGTFGVNGLGEFEFSNNLDLTVFTINSSGNVLAYGGITMYSDIRKKTKLRDVELSLKQIADAPLIEHYYNSDTNKTTHVGSIAQYWASMNDWFCKLDSEGYYTMEIQNAALASAISIARELVKYESKTDRKIRLLKQRVKELEDKIEKLENN